MRDKVKGIARYCHIANPSAAKGTDNFKYSINILIHKTDPQCAEITQAFDQAKANGFPSGFPQNANTAWDDCAIVEPGNAALKDYMCLKANTNVENGKPDLVDHNIQPIIDPAIDGSITGHIIWAAVSQPMTYTQGSNGVKVYLNGVMDTNELGPIPEEALSSKPTASQMFGDVAGGASAGQTAGPGAISPPGTVAGPGAISPPPEVDPHQMTATAPGAYDACIAAGWSDDLLIEHGHMLPPGGQKPAFM